MKRYAYLLILLPVLGACNVFGGTTSPLSATCYTNPQTTPSAQLELGSAAANAGAAYVPGRLLVSYRAATELQSAELQSAVTGAASAERLLQKELTAAARTVRKRYDLRSLGVLGTEGTELVRTPPGADLEQLAGELRRDPRVRYAEPDYYLYPLGLPSANASQMALSHAVPSRAIPARAVAARVTPAQAALALPNDPLIGEQWHLLGFGLPAAWRLETGKADVVLAVLDSGVDLTHEDLAGRALPGCDVYNQDNDPSPGSPSQLGANQRHGTHVAGIALASGDNGKGVAGVAYTGVKLLPVKVLDDNGGDPKRTSVSVVVKAIRWAAGLSVEGMNRNPYPANIINLSLGGKGYIESLNDAVQAARNAGTLVVAAAGNEYLTGEILTPANAPGALAVGSVDEDYRRSEFSNYNSSGRSVRPDGSRWNRPKPVRRHLKYAFTRF